MLGPASAVMVCVLAAATTAAQGTASVAATPVGEEGKAQVTRRTVYLFPGTKTLTVFNLVQVKSTTYATCLATQADLAPCSPQASARYYVATPLALGPTAVAEAGTPIEIHDSGDAADTSNRGILFHIPVVLPFKQEVKTFTTALVTATVKDPNVTVTLQVTGCNPPELPIKDKFEPCPAPSDINI
ncbi:uncharacterized protein LOC126981016 [Eriocheir sinensis]|uniref:uncharacterized protein LOC126981016 n=1 Tax=Eriocheir sinensis TaxID=95602 RepID=UPI0021C7B6E6|nr:uncharacterized protein LOC126981016 [Eriocheir sinensis]